MGSVDFYLTVLLTCGTIVAVTATAVLVRLVASDFAEAWKKFKRKDDDNG
jgi:hypothetical protein